MPKLQRSKLKQLSLFEDLRASARSAVAIGQRAAMRREAKYVGQMRTMFGPGPTGARCGECIHLVARLTESIGYSCDLGPKTNDWKPAWAACGKYCGASDDPTYIGGGDHAA